MPDGLVTIEFKVEPNQAQALRTEATAMRLTVGALAQRAVTEWLSAKPSGSTLALAEDLDALAARRATDDEVLGLIACLRHFASEADRLAHLATADLSLLRMGRDANGFTLEASGRAVAALAGNMAAWLRHNEVENYTETAFTHLDAPYLVTVQRAPRSGRTPHGLRLAAEARAEAAEARVAELEASLAGREPLPAGGA